MSACIRDLTDGIWIRAAKGPPYGLMISMAELLHAVVGERGAQGRGHGAIKGVAGTVAPPNLDLESVDADLRLRACANASSWDGADSDESGRRVCAAPKSSRTTVKRPNSVRADPVDPVDDRPEPIELISELSTAPVGTGIACVLADGIGAVSGTRGRMRVMLVDDDPERAAVLRQSLTQSGYEVIGTIPSDSDLYAAVLAKRPEVIVIDVEAPGRDTLEQMRTITREQPRPIVMFSDDGERSMIKAAIQAGVSAYIVDGLNPDRVKPIMEVAIARFHEFNALRREAEKGKAMLEDRKIIERAKGLLMSARRYSEPEAYQVLQKMAMDTNRRLVDVARDIIAITRHLT